MPYLSALEVCSRRRAIQMHVYLTLPYLTCMYMSVSDIALHVQIITTEPVYICRVLVDINSLTNLMCKNTNYKTKHKLNPGSVTSYDLRLETEWDYSGRKGRDGQKKKKSKANERKRKVKKGEKTRK